ncbi:OTUD4-like protein [Mya arenaria]|uniref:OTUD4-like protein n=1 Tax=Mya arenaria TaxID=6604 RepID=A0ABY7E4R3_MYAAR|nr:uncharacterized protein LOC128234595 [Mya arenaria]WAR04993.1 OTUD4-like protein [Mya arenaria]
MTIVGSIFPEHSPWDSLWSWQPGHRQPHWNSFEGWRDHASHSRTEIEIPIQIVDSDHFDSSDEWSDVDDYDMNNSSRRASKRSRDETSKFPTENDELLAASLNLDNYESSDDPFRRNLRRKPLREETRSSSYNTRSHGVKSSETICIDVDDDEKEINGTSNYSVYQYLKGFLNSQGRQIDGIKGDGNCFFRALSKIIYGNQKYYNEIRQAVVDVIEKHPKKFEAFTDGPISEHIADIRVDKTWGTQTEIYAAATLLNRDFYILSPDNTGETYRWLLFQPQVKLRKTNNLTGCDCCITICHTHGNHYDRIAPLSGKCNCELGPPEMSGIKGQIDLTSEDEIV